MATGGAGPPKPFTPPTGPEATLGEYYTGFHHARADHRKTVAAIIAQCGALRGAEVTAGRVQAMCAMWTHYTPVTRRTLHCLLRLYLGAAGVRTSAYLGIPLLKPVRPRNVTCPDGEFAAVYEQASPKLQITMLLARDAAIRLGTILKLRPEHIDFEGNTIQSRTKAYATFRVPMTERLREKLLWAVGGVREGETLLQQFNRGRLVPTQGSISAELAKVKKQLGLPSPTWGCHDLRRTAARQLYERCHDLRKVQRLLGHSNTGSTIWYLDDATIELTAAELEPPERKQA